MWKIKAKFWWSSPTLQDSFILYRTVAHNQRKICHATRLDYEIVHYTRNAGI